MNIFTCYNGDQEDRLKLKQHDVYPESLDLIVKICNELTRFARQVCQDKANRNWGDPHPYNPKNLRDVHDILAAAFRFYNDLQQLELFRSDKKTDPVIEWHRWLENEVRGWINYPNRVRWVQKLIHVDSHDDDLDRIAMNFNNDLTSYYYEVPWIKDTHFFEC